MQHNEVTFVSFCTGVGDGTNKNRAVHGLIEVPFTFDFPTGQMASWSVLSKSIFSLKEKRKMSDTK